MSPASSATTRPFELKAEIWPALGAAALATAIGIWVLQLWKAKLQVPFVFGPSDPLFAQIAIKDVITHGWDLTNPSLGAPFGQELYDYPAFSGDSFYMAIIKVLGIFSGSLGVVTNIFFLLGFPLIAMTAFGVLRLLGISIGVAIVCAVLYAVLPFRLESYETHIFLASYFIVPICCYLVLAMFKGSELFGRARGRGGVRAYLTGRSAAIVALCLLVGCCDNYFSLFTVALMVPAAILAFLASRRLRPLACGMAAASIILGAVALNGLPTIVYHAQHGPNTLPTTRTPQETGIWGLSLTNLVMPIEGNRIPFLANLAHRYDSTVILPESAPGSEPAWTNLGLVGTLGLLWLVVVLGIHCVRGARSKEVDLRGVHAALGAGMAFLIGTVGGLATLFAYVVNPQLHAPARIVVFIAFFALFGAALGLDRLRGRYGRHPRGRGAFVAGLVGVLLVGVLYQTSPSMVPNYKAEIEQYELHGKFDRAIESQVPPGASIFQLPYVPFPQGRDPAGIGAYEDLYGYVLSNDLRWSGGAMEGRPTDWVPAFLEKPLPQILEGVSATGFQGIYVDTAGIPESGAVLLELRNALGVEPLRGVDGRLAFFNMAAYNRRFRERHSAAQIASIAAAALHPRGLTGR